MKFSLNPGVRPNGDIIPLERRGNILPCSKEAIELRQKLASNSPRVNGKAKVTV